HYSGRMETSDAVKALAALAQETRLQVFKRLIEYGRDGVTPGALSQELGVPHNTLSFHLSHLTQPGLVSSRKAGRSVIYTADCQRAESLVAYLLENCCARERGDASTCAVPACKPKETPTC